MHRILAGLLLAGLAPWLVGITTPSSGAVLRGTVSISGGNRVESGDFSRSELAFAYAGDATGTWFLIAAQNEIIEDGVLATWDTTSITDGDYALRLRVYLQDGTTNDVTVTGLQVRNDVPVSTATPPIPTQDLPTLEPSPLAPTPVLVPVTVTVSPPEPSPGNPAALTNDSVLSTFRRGAVFAVIAIAMIAIFLRLRSLR